MATMRDITTNHADVACDVCGRTLLRGERAESFLAGGARRQVCELCRVRAQAEGWIREDGGEELHLRATRHEGRGRSWLDRLRSRRRSAPEPEWGESRETDGAPEPGEGRFTVSGERDAAAYESPREPAAASVSPLAEPSQPRRPRHVRAVPTNAELKMQRALEVFNLTDHPRTVGGVARSLGAPAVAVRPLADRPSVVTISVMWELSWYRYEIDLSDEATGVRRMGQGDELSELADADRAVNAAADERGLLSLLTRAPA